MLLRLTSRFFVSSSLLPSTSTLIPSRLANTFIDEQYIRENSPSTNQSISSKILQGSSST
ncbi:unnamed protein product, partial [Rotaria magnacalcarata]